ncbi:hypothetical protein [Microbacterium sp. CPCC 204701]|nr:hypothetical protein [Microbacterium sp. CPCC 204701]
MSARSVVGYTATDAVAIERPAFFRRGTLGLEASESLRRAGRVAAD